MKTYQITEELLKKVISAIVDYEEDSEELDNLEGIKKWKHSIQRT